MRSNNNERGTDKGVGNNKQVRPIGLSKRQMEPILKARRLRSPISLRIDRYLHSFKNRSFAKNVIHELRKRANSLFCRKGSQVEREVQD